MKTHENQNEPNQGSLQEGFPFRSYKQTLTILNCSKFYLEKLVNSGIIKKYYFEFKDGKGCGKPYFKIQNISNALITQQVIDQDL
jgi:hypothetical protein